MIQRIFSTVTLWGVVALALILWQAPAGVWLLSVLCMFTQFEFYQLLKKIGHTPYVIIGLIMGLLLMIGTWYGVTHYGYSPVEVPFFIVTFSVVLLSISLLLNPCKSGIPTPLLPTLFGILFVPFMLHFLVQIVLQYTLVGLPNQGLSLALWLIATAKFTDIGGLLIGTQLGKHKMAPIISPGKTWEGAIGGVFFAMGMGGLLCVLGKEWLPLSFSCKQAIFFAIPISFFAIISDLVQSVLKRQAQTKDSGYFIPGIGGAFDLTDSLILTAPIGFYLFKIFTF